MASPDNTGVQLNDEQRKLVEDNHNLIWWFIHYKCPSAPYIDDIYGMLAIVLCNCALKYDPEKGAFSTLVTRAFSNIVARYWRLAKMAPRAIHLEDMMSLDFEYSHGEDVCTPKEFIPDKHNPGYDMAELRVLYAQTEMTPMQRTVMYYKLYGEYTDTEIAKLMGNISRERVRQLKRRGLEAMGISANT